MTDETESERLIRIETKLDLVIGQHSLQLNDHEERLRTVEAQPACPPNIDERVRALELKRTISPKELAGSSATVIAIIAGFIALMDRLFQ